MRSHSTTQITTHTLRKTTRYLNVFATPCNAGVPGYDNPEPTLESGVTGYFSRSQKLVRKAGVEGSNPPIGFLATSCADGTCVPPDGRSPDSERLKSVLASRWQVPDRETAFLMNAFYGELNKGRSTANRPLPECQAAAERGDRLIAVRQALRAHRPSRD
jgi:hypothetical protein